MNNSSAAHSPSSLRNASPRGRIAALADPDSVQWFPPAGASPHIARYGMSPREDDGIVVARIRMGGVPMLVAAQDEKYLAGSVGERHGIALQSMLVEARRERPAAIVLLLASGGVRLHEANAAELALGRALAALLDARADGIAVVAIGVGNVFGGTSVLACAADRLAMLPGTRIGLSGPKVLESVHGKWELDADEERDVEAVFGAKARSALGFVDLLADDADARARHGCTARRAIAPISRPASPQRTRCCARASQAIRRTRRRSTRWRASTAPRRSTTADGCGCATSAG